MKIQRADCGARTRETGSQSDRQGDVIRVMQSRRLMPVMGVWISTHVHTWGSLPESDTGYRVELQIKKSGEAPEVE